MAKEFDEVLTWLTEPSEPSIRLLSLTDLLKVKSSKLIEESTHDLLLRGWVARILNNQASEGYWVNPHSCYQPKYTATVWQLQLLAMLNVDGFDPRIRKACDRFLLMHTMSDGGFTCSVPSFPNIRSEECIVGRMLAVLIHFGFGPRNPKIANATRWLLNRRLHDGGWNCRYLSHPRHSSLYSTYMALWGLSKFPETERTGQIKDAISQGVEFMLNHKLFRSHRSGRVIKEHWLSLHFPPVNYDILNGLKLMTDLGVTSDERLSDALDLLETKMRPDGRWLTEYVPSGYPEKAGQPSIKFERAREPSKWITLQSLIVLSRTGGIKVPTP